MAEPQDLIGHRFTATGVLTLAPASGRRAFSPERRQALEAEGWNVHDDGGRIELSASDAGIFSGRWTEYKVAVLEDLAKDGFEGVIEVEGEGLTVVFDVTGGGLVKQVAKPRRSPG